MLTFNMYTTLKAYVYTCTFTNLKYTCTHKYPIVALLSLGNNCIH